MTWTGEWTATAISDRVRSGDLDPVAAVVEAIDRIEGLDPIIGAFQTVLAERAIAEAQGAPKGPLAGVPIAIKDNVAVAGEPLRLGSRATSAEPMAEDHPVVARLRAAGAIPVGITAVPEMCTFGTTDTPDRITRNPWNTARTPGGSSGGSAAAVASGMVPVAHGADGMGSIRIPAAASGIVGIKPGMGVVPAELGSTDWYGLAENGAFATTVEDAALVLSVMAARPDLVGLAEPDPGLRIGVMFRPPVAGVELDKEQGRAAARAAAILRHEGHTLDHVEISPTNLAANAAAVSAIARWFAGVAIDTADLDQDLLEDRTRVHASLGRVALQSPAMSDGLRDRWLAMAESLFADHDLLITPALAAPPIAADTWHQRSWLANVVANVRYAPYAAPWNLAGYPAMVVPLGLHSAVGTPVAAQLVGPPGSEALLLSAAKVIERVQPWERTAPIR